MTAKIYTLFLICMTFGIVSCSYDSSELNSPNHELNLEFSEILNVSYGNNSDQVFDIYLPENRTLETKVMLLIHDGNQPSSDKANMSAIKNLMLTDLKDVALVNLNYKLIDDTNLPFMTQIKDITAVINYLKQHQKEFVISKDFAFFGDGTGAHLAMLYSYTLNSENQIKMVISLGAPTNLTDPAYIKSEHSFGQKFTNTPNCSLSLSDLNGLSPYHQVTASAPPTLLFYGEEDSFIPLSQGVNMEAKLASLGVTHQYIVYSNVGHDWKDLKLQDTWSKVRAFTETHLVD